LLQLQADALGLPLSVGRTDATVLGAAMLAGVGAGTFASVEQAARQLPAGTVVTPVVDPAERSRARARWREFVRASAAL
jgi:glycerol kinase